MGQIFGGIRGCPGLQRPVRVAAATVVRSTMERETMQSNHDSYRNGGGQSHMNQMLELGLVI